MPKRNTVFLILVLPAAVLLWTIGWFLCWINLEKELGRLKERSTSNELQVLVLTSEEKHVVKETPF
jgi:hypothetical protein